jgi:hypothetical protein
MAGLSLKEALRPSLSLGEEVLRLSREEVWEKHKRERSEALKEWGASQRAPEAVHVGGPNAESGELQQPGRPFGHAVPF